jgi:hypothetical protein
VTLDEYLDPKRFPLTTRPDLSPSDQLVTDAFAYDRFKALAERGELQPDEATIWAELQAKLEDYARLVREVAAEERDKVARRGAPNYAPPLWDLLREAEEREERKGE